MQILQDSNPLSKNAMRSLITFIDNAGDEKTAPATADETNSAKMALSALYGALLQARQQADMLRTRCNNFEDELSKLR